MTQFVRYIKIECNTPRIFWLNVCLRIPKKNTVILKFWYIQIDGRLPIHYEKCNFWRAMRHNFAFCQKFLNYGKIRQCTESPIYWEKTYFWRAMRHNFTFCQISHIFYFSESSVKMVSFFSSRAKNHVFAKKSVFPHIFDI